MHPEEKKEEIRGFYSSLLVSFVIATIIIFAALLKFSSSPPHAQQSRQDESMKAIEVPLQKNTQGKDQSGAESPLISEDEIKSEKKSASPSLSAGAELHRAGKFDSAAREWLKAISLPEHRNDYTIQLLLACKRETLVKAFKNLPDHESLYYVKARYKDMACYKLCMGLYGTRKEAEAGRTALPGYFSGTDHSTAIVPVSKLIEGIEGK